MTTTRSTDQPGRRRALLCALAAAMIAPAAVAATTPALFAEVWKDPNCGCCKDWVDYLVAAGFKVKVNDTGNEAVRSRLGVERRYGSCHTALIGGYAIEGHVPVREIRRLLKERPNAIGLAVPGMPVGSPGMDGSVYGPRKDPYDVMLLAKNGSAAIYQHYEGKKS